MQITSLEFMAFVGLIFIIYYLFPTNNGKKIWLLALSIVFYLSWSENFLFILLGLSYINFLLAKQISLIKSKSKLLVWLGILINVGGLGLLKYADFYLPRLLLILEDINVHTNSGAINILLPIGLSFYVVQGISYLVDVYMGRMEPESDLIGFFLYTMYFPKILSGPIERAKPFIQKINNPEKPSRELFSTGFSLILMGVFRKAIFADPLIQLIPDRVFEQPKEYFAPVLVSWLLAYGIALYNDFAGYSAIMRGVSHLFGIKLTQNFRNPYFSRNFTEFWSRWHISLSNWLRDYIYFPISRWLAKLIPNREHIINIVLPPMVTMLISAGWHGVSINMLFWGLLHGSYQVVELIFRKTQKNQPESSFRKFSGIITTAVFTTLAWVPFRAEISVVFDYWRGIFFLPHWSRMFHILNQHIQNPGTEWMVWELQVLPSLKIVVLIVFSLFIDWLQDNRGDELMFRRWPSFYKYGFVGLILILTFLINQVDSQAPFIYQGF